MSQEDIFSVSCGTDCWFVMTGDVAKKYKNLLATEITESAKAAYGLFLLCMMLKTLDTVDESKRVEELEKLKVRVEEFKKVLDKVLVIEKA